MTKKKQVKPDPILDDAPTVTIADTDYPLRRLGLRDVFRVARILGNGVAVIGDARYTEGQVAQVLVASMSQNEEEVLKLVADLLGVKRDALDDAEAFPMDAIVDVFQTLAQHQDLKAFLGKLKGMLESVPAMSTP